MLIGVNVCLITSVYVNVFALHGWHLDVYLRIYMYVYNISYVFKLTLLNVVKNIVNNKIQKVHESL